MNEKSIPAPGQWFKRTNRSAHSSRLANHPVDIVQIGEVDAAKEKIETKRFDGFDKAGEPIWGRSTKVSFETWRGEHKYTPTDEPVPPMLDRERAIRMLEARGFIFEDAEEMVNDPRKQLAQFRDDDVPEDDPGMVILRAHVAYLEANGPDSEAPPSAEKLAAEDDLTRYVRILRGDHADLKAEIAALRQDFRALVDALKADRPQMGLPFGKAA